MGWVDGGETVKGKGWCYASNKYVYYLIRE